MMPSHNPERTQRTVLLALEDVLGEGGLRTILHAAERANGALARPNAVGTVEALPRSTDIPPDVLLRSLEETYGEQPGRGLARRTGRACFQYALREYGDALELTRPAFRLLPLPAKLKRFGEALAGLFNQPAHERIRTEEQDGKLFVHLLHCPLCAGRHATLPVCQLAVGLAEETLYWLSGGKMFLVEETACAARGDVDCVLLIDKAPIS